MQCFHDSHLHQRGSSTPKCAGLLSEGSVDRQALVAASKVHKKGMLGLYYFACIKCNGPEQHTGRGGAISIEKQINKNKLKSRKITFALLFVLHAYRRVPESL